MVAAAELESWRTELGSLSERLGEFCVRPEPRQRLRQYMAGLLGGAQRRNAWYLAEAAGEAKPYGMQRLVASAGWDADEVCEDLAEYVIEHLGDASGVLVLDETGFLKKGDQSAGVARQYSGTAGKVENCQIGVFLAYAAPGGVAFLDRALYLPESWTCDRARCRKAGIPAEVEFATKPELGRQMLGRALLLRVPHAWVVADEVYGQDRRLRHWLEDRGEAFVLAVPTKEKAWVQGEAGPRQVRVDTLAQALPQSAWQRLSAGSGSKGERLYDWAEIALWRHGAEPGVDRLLVRRSIADPQERAYYLVHAPRKEALEAVVRVAGSRWAIEVAFEAAKQEVGLDEYEVRKWDAWHRFITLALFAHAFLAVQRARVEKGGAVSLRRS